MRDFLRKALLVLIVFGTGLLGGFQFAAWYLAENVRPDTLANEQARLALAQIKSVVGTGWIGLAFLVIAMLAFLSTFKVSRHDGK